MAKDDFSVVLPTDGTIINAPVYNPGPSALDPVLNTISSGIRQFGQDMDERAKKKKEEKEAAKAEEERRGRATIFDGIRSIDRAEGAEQKADPWRSFVTSNLKSPAINQPATAAPSANPDVSTAIIDGAVSSGAVTPERMGELETEISTQGEQISLVDTSISQGSMPASAKDAAIDRLLLDVRARFPDMDTEVIVSMMDKMGIKTALAYNIKREYADMEKADNTRSDYIESARKAGLEVLGDAAMNLPQEQVIQAGSASIRGAQERKLIKDNLEISMASTNLSEKQMELEEKAAARQMNQVTVQSAVDTFAPLVNAGRDLIDMMTQNPGGNPALEDQFRETMGSLKSRVAVLVENYKNEVITSTGDVTQATAIADSLTATLKATLLDPLENRDSDYLRMVKTLETNLGLKTTEAFPIIAMMKSVGVNLPLADLLMGNVDGPTATRLAEELKGITTQDIYSLRGRETAGTQLLQMIRVLEGDTTLNQMNMSPAQTAAYFKTINKTTNDIGKKMRSGDMGQQEAYLNGMGEVAVAAEQLSRGSSLVSLSNAVTSLVGGGAASNFKKLMTSGDDPEKAQLVALGTRAGVARAMEGLKTKPTSYGFYDVAYSRAQGKWSVAFNEDKWRTNPRSRGGYDPMDTKLGINAGSRSRPPVPSEATAMMHSLNNASNFLVETASFDEGAPKGSPKELRDWYNEGKMPKSMQQELIKKREATKAGPMEALNAFETVLQDGDFSLKSPTRPGAGGLAVDAQGKIVKTEVINRMESAARSAGFSAPVIAGILANVQHESGFDPSGVGDSGSAFGYFQHRKERVDNFKKIIGVRPEAATPEQAIKFFKWELDNPEEAGMTKDQAREIKAADTPEEAAMLIQKYYERPKNVNPARGNTARAFYAD